MSDSLVIIPTYNEKENIEAMIRKVFSLEKKFDLLIVDDGSPDGTAAIIKSLQKEFDGLHILERAGKQGLGTAYIAGFRYALARNYGFVFEMDADFSHSPDDLKRLYDACATGGAHLAVGSRYVKGGNVSNWDFKRVMLSYMASAYVNIVLWLGVRDSTAGFKCYRREVLENISLDRIRFIGYAFQIEMKYNAKRLGYKIVEVPITFVDRELGHSKMSMGIFHEAFLGVLKMRFRKIVRANGQ